MTSKAITLEFIIPTVLAIALGVALSIGAVYLIDSCFSSIDQVQGYYLTGLVKLG